MKMHSLMCAGSALLLSMPAHAYNENNISSANATEQFEVNVCAGPVQLNVFGDGSSDLDFAVLDPNGNAIFANDDPSDEMVTTLDGNPNGQCWTYTLIVENLGSRNFFTTMVTSRNYDSVMLTANSEFSNNSTMAVIDPQLENRIGLAVCSPQASFDASGEGNTDLDFMIIDDSSGSVVHEDDDLTDVTSATLRGMGGSGCRTYTLIVANIDPTLSNEVNLDLAGMTPRGQRTGLRMQTSAPQATRPSRPVPSARPTRPARPTPSARPTQGKLPNQARPQGRNAGALNAPRSTSMVRDTSGGSRDDVEVYAVQANSTMVIDLYLCGSSVTIDVNGDGDTDVDYQVFDARGALLHSDAELHDDMFVVLNTQASSGACQTTRLEAQNLGSIFNNVTVTLTDN